MRAVVQRVSRASVRVGAETVAAFEAGLLALVGVEHDDASADVGALAEKLVHLRVFPDADGKMNCSLLDTGGSLGIVSQFTLLGDARKGRRPSYARAAPPEHAERLIEALSERCRSLGPVVRTGRFGQRMEVELVNDGPVTLLLDTRRAF